MPIGILFWVIFILILIFWGADSWGGWPYGRYGWGIALLVELFLLGWKVFGFILQG